MICTFNGLVVKEALIGEDNKIITVITPEHGKVPIYVRNGQKLTSKSIGATQLFCYSKFNIILAEPHSLLSRLSSYLLQSADLIRNFSGFMGDFLRMTCASYICQLLDFCIEKDQECNDAMRLALNCLHHLHNKTRPTQQIKCIFELRLMCEIGFRPELVACKICCEYEKNMNFSFSKSYLICDRCLGEAKRRSILPLSPSLLHAIRFISLTDFERLFNFRMSDELCEELTNFTETYLLNKLGRSFLSLDLYKKYQNFL